MRSNQAKNRAHGNRYQGCARMRALPWPGQPDSAAACEATKGKSGRGATCYQQQEAAGVSGPAMLCATRSETARLLQKTDSPSARKSMARIFSTTTRSTETIEGESRKMQALETTSGAQQRERYSHDPRPNSRPAIRDRVRRRPKPLHGRKTSEARGRRPGAGEQNPGAPPRHDPFPRLRWYLERSRP